MKTNSNSFKFNQWWLGIKAMQSSLPFIGSTEGSIAATIGCTIILIPVVLIAVAVALVILFARGT